MKSNDMIILWKNSASAFLSHGQMNSLLRDGGKMVGRCCGMSTAQCTKSINSFFDKYIHKKIFLKEFVKQ